MIARSGRQYVQNPDALQRRCPDRVLILPPQGEVQILAGSALALWSTLARWATSEEIVEDLRANLVDTPGNVSSVVTGLLSDLVERGAVVDRDDG